MAAQTGNVGPARFEGKSSASAEASSSPLSSQQVTIDDGGEYEFWNVILLGVVFMVYFGFRSGCLVVIPLACKELLKDTTHFADRSPLYNLPLGLWFLMDILLATPNAYLMRRHGRRGGFIIGGVAALFGSLVCFGALRFCPRAEISFIALNAGVVVMSEVGMSEFVRFAAGEACPDRERRGKVVSRVIGFGACLSMIGPGSASGAQEISRALGDDVLRGYSYFFLCTAVLSIIMVVAAGFLRLPPIPSEAMLQVEPLFSILRRPAVCTAILAQVTVQFAMVAPMSGIPLVMTAKIPELHPADFRISGCIVLHVLAMFVPGFFAGNVIGILGENRVMGIGLVIQAASLVICLTGTDYARFYSGLFLLGIGWNLAFVAGTLLVVSSHTPAERAKVTSANETLRFAANALGVVLATGLDWDVLCIVSLLSLLPAAAVVVQRSLRVDRWEANGLSR